MLPVMDFAPVPVLVSITKQLLGELSLLELYPVKAQVRVLLYVRVRLVFEVNAALEIVG